VPGARVGSRGAGLCARRSTPGSCKNFGSRSTGSRRWGLAAELIVFLTVLGAESRWEYGAGVGRGGPAHRTGRTRRREDWAGRVVVDAAPGVVTSSAGRASRAVGDGAARRSAGVIAAGWPYGAGSWRVRRWSHGRIRRDVKGCSSARNIGQHRDDTHSLMSGF